MTKKVILTGLRANNELTLGNYFGAMKPMIDMANTRAGDYTINMFIPDLHSFTTPTEHETLYEQIVSTARMFIAAGLPTDNSDINMYRQSFVSAHSELTWILDCFTGMGELSRMTQFKDKSDGYGDDRVSVGLFNYPVLMASDILLYNASYVPVGDDQTQHLEFTRNIAERFNNKFGDIFVIPLSTEKQADFFGGKTGLRLRDLVDPTKKMSKSSQSNRGVIFLTDNPDEVEKKIMSATTDSKGAINLDPDSQPGITNLITILSLLRGVSIEETASQFIGSSDYGSFKTIVATELNQFLSTIQQKYISTDDSLAIDFLCRSEQSVKSVANETLEKVQIAVGLRKKG